MTQPVPAGAADFRRHINAGLESQGQIAAWRPDGAPTAKYQEQQEKHAQEQAQRSHRAVCELVHDGNELREDLFMMPLKVPPAPSRKHCHLRNPPDVTTPAYRAVGPRDGSLMPVLAPSAPQAKRPVRRRMYELRDALRPIGRTTATVDDHPVSRIAVCGYATTSTTKVGVVLSPEGRARFSGVLRCGSVWECPVCSLAIRTKRSDEVRHVIEQHGTDRCVMVTLTVRHGCGDDLRVTRARLADAWRAMTRGAAWKRAAAELGLVGSIRALEVTNGKHGWHPHLHVVFLLAKAPDPAELIEVNGSLQWLCSRRGWLIDRWVQMTARYVDVAISCPCGAEYTESEANRAGGQCRCGTHLWALPPSEKKGSAVADADHGLAITALSSADYLCKLGLEVTHPGKKASRSSRSPLEIADDWARYHRRADAKLWRTYCEAMLGARQLTWSANLKRRFGLRERTDIELSADEETTTEDRIIATITIEQWRDLRSHRGYSVQLLEAAERSGRSGVERWLVSRQRDGP